MNKDKRKTNAKSQYVSVIAPARLHLGFLDLHGGLGWKFGSIGLAVSAIETSLTASYSDDIDIKETGVKVACIKGDGNTLSIKSWVKVKPHVKKHNDS